MLKIKEAIVVEGRYDKNTLSQLVDGVILETGGFGIYKDRAALALLRRLAEKQGLIVLTDSDGAGFQIRSYLKMKISDSVVMFCQEAPDLPGVFLSAVKRPVHKLHLRDPALEKEHQLALYKREIAKAQPLIH